MQLAGEFAVKRLCTCVNQLRGFRLKASFSSLINMELWATVDLGVKI